VQHVCRPFGDSNTTELFRPWIASRNRVFSVFIRSAKRVPGNRARTVTHIARSRLDSSLRTENSGHWKGRFQVSPAPAIDSEAMRESDAENLWQNSRNIKQ
jgi:hypothetical protein